jgi:hypothetical protein
MEEREYPEYPVRVVEYLPTESGEFAGLIGPFRIESMGVRAEMSDSLIELLGGNPEDYPIGELGRVVVDEYYYSED